MSDPAEQPETPAQEAAPGAAAPAPEAEALPAARTYTEAEFRKVQNEAKNLRERLQTATAAASEAGNLAPALEAAQAEATTLREQLAQATAELSGYRLRERIAGLTEPATLGEGGKPNPLHGRHARLLARLIDPAAIQYGEDGEPKNLRKLAETALAEYGLDAAPTVQRVSPQPPAGGRGGTARAVVDDDLIAQKRRQIPAL